MMCPDCAQTGQDAPAVGVCSGCGAAVCHGDGQAYSVQLTCAAPPVGRVPVDTPARVLRCLVCAAAHTAQRACETEGIRACTS